MGGTLLFWFTWPNSADQPEFNESLYSRIAFVWLYDDHGEYYQSGQETPTIAAQNDNHNKLCTHNLKLRDRRLFAHHLNSQASGSEKQNTKLLKQLQFSCKIHLPLDILFVIYGEIVQRLAASSLRYISI